MFYWLTFVQMKFCDVKLLENQKTEKKKRERDRERHVATAQLPW